MAARQRCDAPAPPGTRQNLPLANGSLEGSSPQKVQKSEVMSLALGRGCENRRLRCVGFHPFSRLRKSHFGSDRVFASCRKAFCARARAIRRPLSTARHWQKSLPRSAISHMR